MEPRTIVAIEIASSKIKGAAAAVGPDGKLTILAVEEIADTNNVRYGRIQNIREVSGAVNEIVRQLESAPAVAPRKVQAMAVSLGGRSLSAAPAKAALRFPHECEITESQVQRLMFEATRDFMGDKNIEATVPRTFYVNNAAVPKAVGTFGETLRGEFMMITCGKETRQNLDRLKYDTVDPENVCYVLRPTAVADFVLSSDERELGCALVDFGAETTTVSVYTDGSLAFLCTIPMGSRLITLDLMAGLGITEKAAENHKLTLDSLSPEHPDAEEVKGYVHARAGEIAANIVNQLELSGYADSIAKIVLTGGGAKLSEFAALLGAQCKLPVRVAEMSPDVAFRVAGRNNPDNIDIVALLAAAARSIDSDCLSQPAPARAAAPAADEFDPEEEAGADEPDDTEGVPYDPEEEEEAYERTQRTAARRQAGPRKPPAEDDPDLLDDDDDDDDDETEEEEEAPRRRGIFGFARRQKEETAPVDGDDGYDVFEPEDEEDDGDSRADENDDPDNFKKTTKVFEGIRNRFLGIFTGDDDDDDKY